MFRFLETLTSSVLGIVFLVLFCVLLFPVALLIAICLGIAACCGLCLGDRNNPSAKLADIFNANNNLEKLQEKIGDDLSLDNSHLTKLAETMQKLNAHESQLSKSEKKELKKTIKHELKEFDAEIKTKLTKQEIHDIKKAVKHTIKELSSHQHHLFSHKKVKNSAALSVKATLTPGVSI